MKRVYFDRHTIRPNSIGSRIWSPDAPELELHGLERVDLANAANESCIPTGVYQLAPWKSPKFGEVYTFVGGCVSPEEDAVPSNASRFACHLHAANYWYDLNGCTAPGMSGGENKGECVVWRSRDALSRFRDLLGYEPLLAYVRYRVEPEGA